MEPLCSLPWSQQPATCPCPEIDKSSPVSRHPISLISILISSIYACVFQVVTFPQVFPSDPCMHSPSIRVPCPDHHICLDFMIRITFGEQNRSLSSSLCSLLHSPLISSALGPNICLNTLFSNTLSHCFSSVCYTCVYIGNDTNWCY